MTVCSLGSCETVRCLHQVLRGLVLEVDLQDAKSGPSRSLGVDHCVCLGNVDMSGVGIFACNTLGNKTIGKQESYGSGFSI